MSAAKRKWRRDGKRVYRFDSDKAQSIIFAAPFLSMWAWGVWGSHFTQEGIESSLERAKRQAEKWIDAVMLAEKSADGAA